jgi:hypothetical protein
MNYGIVQPGEQREITGRHEDGKKKRMGKTSSISTSRLRVFL